MTFDEWLTTTNIGEWDARTATIVRHDWKTAWDAAVKAERERVLRIVRKYGGEYAHNSSASDAAEGIEREIVNAEQGKDPSDAGPSAEGADGRQKT